MCICDFKYSNINIFSFRPIGYAISLTYAEVNISRYVSFGFVHDLCFNWPIASEPKARNSQD